MIKLLVLPFIAYLLGTTLVARFGETWYPLGYGTLVVLLGGLVGWLLYSAPENPVRPHVRIGTAVGTGLLGIALWIGFCSLQLEQQLFHYLPGFLQPDSRVAYNPFEHLDGWQVWAFLAVRLAGIALLVPIAEELFWRGFLLRWLIDPDWEKVPYGEFTLSSCAIVTLMFTLAHPEWLAAATYCLLMHGLWYWKKDLWLCIVAHSVSNLALAIYVLVTGDWVLW